MTREEIKACAEQAGEETGLCFDPGTAWLWRFVELLEARLILELAREGGAC